MPLTIENLQSRFGNLVAAHRKQAGLTQAQLAERSDLSEDMIARIEVGGTGVRFGSMVKLANALEVDPANLFITDGSDPALQRAALSDLTAQLAKLNDRELEWIKGVIAAAVRSK